MKNFLVFVAVLFAHQAQARWANLSDAGSKALVYNIVANVEKNSMNFEAEIVNEIVKESGRDIATWHHTYNPEIMSIQVVEAYTENKKQKTKVPPSAIVDKAMQVSTQGFDQFNELVVAFPQAEVGAKTHLKLRATVKKYPLRLFTWRFGISDFGAVEKLAIIVRSKIPLYSELSDPGAKLQLAKQQDKNLWTYILSNNAPIYEQVIDENHPWLSEKETSWWKVSEIPTYSELPKRVVEDYERVAKEPLPELHKQVLAASKGEKVEDLINSMTAELQRKMRYMGDWRGVRGTHIPRPLKEVSAHASGDCKDFASSLVAMLRQKGIQAYVAWVWSGESGHPDLGAVPYDGMFNHAIVYVEHGGHVLWVDPTDTRSFAQGIPPHILNRQAMVLDPKNPRLEKIPGESPQPYQFDLKFQTDVSNLEKVKSHASLKYLGGGAYWWTLWSQYASPETIQREIAKNYFDEQELSDYKFSPIDFTDRMVKDIKLEGDVELEPQLVRTTEGQGIHIQAPTSVNSLASLPLKDRVSGFYWNPPFDLHQVTEVKGRRVRGKELQGCRVQSKWFNYQRLYESRGGEFTIDETLKVKQGTLSAQDLRSQDFRTAQEALRTCTQKIVLILKN